MVSVIIVNYNVKYFVEQAVRSVLQSKCTESIEIIVVDNASHDGSVSYLKKVLPDITILESKENLGFAKANNLALEKASGDKILFLNPDTIVSDNTIQAFVDLVQSNPHAGAAGVCMINSDGTFAPESRRALPNPFVSFCKMSGLTAIFPKSRIFGRYYMKYLDKNKANRIQVISGACFFIRKDIALQLQGFDPSFFMYGEDIDLSYRLLKTGMENWYLPVTIMHYKGESTSKTSFRYVRTFYDAMIIFYKKHYRHYNWLLTMAIYLTIAIKKFTTFIKNNIAGIFTFLKKNVRNTYICVFADPSEHTIISSLLTRSGFADNILFSDPSGNFRKLNGRRKPAVLLFSTSKYNYSEILQYMQTGNCKGINLATFSNNGTPSILMADGTTIQ